VLRRSTRQGVPPGYRSPEGFGDVVRGVWFAPRRFFGRLDPEGGPLKPALFASSVLYLNLILDELLRVAWRLEFNYGLLNAALPGLAVALVLGPLLVAGLSALVLTVLDGAPSRSKFGPVFRALGYASGIGVAFWIPFAPILAIPYGALVATIAVKEALNVPTARAAAAALIPLFAVLLTLLALLGPGEAVSFFTNPPQS